jgi:uncharacterized protein (TIGR03437 family)
MRLRSIVFLALVLSWSAWAQTYTISTFAGGVLPVNIPGASANLGYNAPRYMAADAAGNLFFVYQSSVLRMDAATGLLTLVAGNGTTGFSGDNGPATSAQLLYPEGIAVDSAGNLYIADSNNFRVRKVSHGVITTVAGNGTYGTSGDNGPATSAQLGATAVAVDSAGNLYIVDTYNNLIREVSNGVITTAAGTSARFNRPQGVAVDSAGNLYIADTGNGFIRKVSNGVITTVAGIGGPGFSGDNGPATNAQLYFPDGVAVDSAGNLYIADSANQRIRKVANGVITTVAGNGTLGFSGDNGPATGAELNFPSGIAVDSAGNLYIPEPYNSRIRKVSNGLITSVVGNSLNGDSGPASSAQLTAEAVAVDSAGNVYIADSASIRKVSHGVITTVAGNGTPGFSGDNGPATSAQLNTPLGVAVDSAGSVYIADRNNHRIRKVSGGVITTVAGNGTQGFSGDNGPATSAELNYPGGVAVDSTGNVYIADNYNQRVRKVSGGVITTVAGNGTVGFSGDNGPAISAQLVPDAVAVDSAGNLYVADNYNNRVREVSNGIITTVAGNGTPGFSGDNGPATSAQLDYPEGIAVDSAGVLYIADNADSRIRMVWNGVIATVAGNGTGGFSGDNGPATSALLWSPQGVAVDPAGNLYVADTGNNRIRVLTPSGSRCTYNVSPTTLQPPASGGAVAVGIQTAASCPWAVSGLPGWITLSGASSGPASASVALAVFPNNSGAILSATILVAGVPVTVTQPAAATAPLPPIKSVVNAASYVGGPVSPGELVTMFGSGIGPATNGGVEVLFNGTPAPVIYASATQVSAVVPYEMAFISNPSVWIEYAGQTSNAYQLTVTPAAPGLFAQNSAGSGPGAILNQDNSLNGPAHPAAKGSIVQVYMTGEGQTSPQGITGAITTVTLPPPQVTPAPVQPIQVWINGQPATYTYAGEAPGMVAGVMQLNVQIPANAPSGALSIAVSVGGNMSQSGITVWVQ